MTRLVEIHGHRGARGLFPENTLAGFAGARAIGVDRLELDVALTADGVVVVTHDPCLNPEITRGPDGAWLAGPGPRIRDLTSAQLPAFDVGRIDPRSACAARFPDQTPRDGARIPTLDAVLAAFPGARFSVELKSLPDRPGLAADPHVMADAVLDAIARADAADRVLIESFDWRGMRRARARQPGLTRAYLTTPMSDADAALWWDGPRPSDFGGSVPRAVAAEGGPVWGPDHRSLSEAAIAEAHALGLAVAAWTVNEAADMVRLIAWGVDALVTDRPDRARAILGR